MKTRVRRLIALLLFLTSALALAWGLWPPALGARTLMIFPVDMQLPGEAESAEGRTVLEGRALVLEWPERMRVGDSGLIALTLETGQEGQMTPSPQEAGVPETGYQDVYETHFVVAEARLELAGMAYAPTGQISEGLLPGKPAAFFWQVRPPQAGESRGTVWLHLRYLPLDGGEEARRVLSAQIVEIRAVSLFGLSGRWARVLGSVGVIVGAALGLNELLPWIWVQYEKRKNKDLPGDPLDSGKT